MDKIQPSSNQRQNSGQSQIQPTQTIQQTNTTQPIVIVQDDPQESTQKNLNGKALKLCSKNPLTGYYRDGYCVTGPTDSGKHVVCAQLTEEFLSFTKSKGNDLSTPRGGFQGLKPGDNWCLCALRWKQAFQEGVFVPIVVEATNKEALRYATLNEYTTKLG